MFNFNSETWLVVYPHGAGGRLMGLILSLDPAMAGPDGQHSPPGRVREYRNTIMYGLNAHWMTNELTVTGSKCNGVDILATLAYRDRYIFTGHMDQVWLDREFYQQIKNLKVIVISPIDPTGFKALNQRRLPMGGGELKGHELTTAEMTSAACCTVFGEPVMDIDVRDYWDPDRFIPKFTKLIETHNLNINYDEWTNLYLLWYDHLPAAVKEIIHNG